MARDAIVPAAWAGFYEATNIPAAVRVGTMLRLTGHTGDRPDGAFAESAEEPTVAADFLEAPYPAWSAVGVTGLFELEALYELRCVAMCAPDR
jgi:hypothetical protein